MNAVRLLADDRATPDWVYWKNAFGMKLWHDIHPNQMSHPEIKAWSLSGNQNFHLVFQGIPNQSYRLQASTNLVDWFDVSTNTASANGTLV